MNLKSKNLFQMAGTEGTYKYVVVLATVLGRIGFRCLGQGVTRVRVEPFSADAVAALSPTFTRALGWKQPADNGQHRFSRECEEDGCVPESDAFLVNLEKALRALLDASPTTECLVNPEFPEQHKVWVADFAARILKDSLLARAKKLGVRGANKRWKPQTLAARCSAQQAS